MENYLVVLLLSVFVLLGAFYVYTVDQKIIQIKNELLQHGNEIKQGKEELESTRKTLTQVHVDLESTRKELKQVNVELESTRKELKQVNVELESTRKEFKQVTVELESTRNALKQVKVEMESTRNALKQVKVELDSTKEQINILRKEMIEKDNARSEEIDQISADVNALRGELNEIKKASRLLNVPTSAPDIRTVAFYAILSHDELNPGPHHTIAFDLVKTNIHNSYNHFTGAFTAPIHGAYGFIYALRMNCYTAGTFEIMKNDEVEGTIHVNVGNGCSGQFSTGSIVVVLNIRDTVYVRTHSTITPTGVIHSNINGSPYFAGWLISSL